VTDDAPRALLVDVPGEAGRTTVSLVASLAARLASLRLMSGADAVGSLTAGFAALGREVARSTEGARLHEAITAGRIGGNGEAVWAALGIDRMAEAPPSPVLDHLRNDLALLLADDLEETLALLPLPAERAETDDAPAPATFADYLLGMWAFGVEVSRAVEAIAAPTLPSRGVRPGGGAPGLASGPLLR